MRVRLDRRPQPSPSCHRRVGRSDRGFSLIEVVVAATLLAAGLIPVAYIQSSGVRSGFSSYGLLSASALAVDLGDKLRALSYTDTRLAATSGYVTPDATLTSANPLKPDGTTWTGCSTSCGFTRTWQVLNNTPQANMKRIDVRVTWSEYGYSRTYTLSTIKAVGS